MFPEAVFDDRFRMSRSLFTGIVEELTLQCEFFREKEDCTGKLGISPLIKCTSAIRQLAYGTVPNALDEYLQMGNLDCTDWAWFGCPIAHKAQYCRRDHGPDPFALLDAVASNDLWMWHAFFDVSGSNNDINVTQRSPLVNDLKLGKAPEVPFVANDVTCHWGYYLCDRIYQEYVPFVKSVTNLANDDYKRLQYKTRHEAARKDVEREFGVLKNKWEAISPKWYPDEEHQPDDILRSDEQ
nr:hypothetical protein [Tanacetum cinerariifolium]